MIIIDIKTIDVRDYFTPDFPKKDFKQSDNEKQELLENFGFEKDQDHYKFHHNTFSRTYRKYTTIKLLKNNELAIYNHKIGIYELNCDEIINKTIKYCMNFVYDLWNPYHASVALKTIKNDTFDIVQQFNTGEYINLQNGILDLTTFKRYKHAPRYLSTVQLPFEYTSAVPTPSFEKYLDDITCGDDEMKLLLQELLGYCLCNSTAAEKAFFLVGGGCNGKSVFAKIIQMIVGENNYSTTSLSALNGTFGLASLMNTNVNIASENNNGKINSEIFKAIVSGDVVEVNRKYKDALSCQLHTKLVLLFNELPDSSDLTYGFFRKVIVIPFKKTISKEEIDVDLINKLSNELPGIFFWAIEGLKRLRKNKYQFSPCKACDEALEQYKHSLNPVASFFEESFITGQSGSIRKSEIYLTFVQYCNDNSYEVLQCQKFWKFLKSHFVDKGYSFRTKKVKGYDYIEGIQIKHN